MNSDQLLTLRSHAFFCLLNGNGRKKKNNITTSRILYLQGSATIIEWIFL